MVVLASASPQRKTLLEQIGVIPVVIPADIDEEIDIQNIRGSLQKLADRKAQAAVTRIIAERYHKTAFANIEEFRVIGADTVVLVEDTVLGKATDERAARGMLESISGRTHLVLTGVFAGRFRRETEFGFMIQEAIGGVAETEVVFKTLAHEEISWYVATGEWQGAAGAYRIQGRGACLVSGINGSFSNVVGLPIELIYGMLVRLGHSF